MIKQGDIVLAQGHTDPFKVLEVSTDGKTARIQSFNLSRQRLQGQILPNIPCSTLSIFKEDASQAAVRVVREATKE